MENDSEISVLLWTIFNSPSEQIDLILNCVAQLKDIDKETAIKALQTFPMHSLYGKYHPKISSLYIAGQLEYGSIYYWFKHWENPLNNSLKDLQYVEQYEKRALFSKALYQLIEGIKSQEEQPFFSAGCLWLLAEAARCFKQNIGSLDSEAISKRKYYETNQEVNKALEDITQNQNISGKHLKDLPDFYRNFDLVIEAIARKLAFQFPDFDLNYYQPYFRAKKAFNREMRGSGFKILSFSDNPRQRKPNK